MELSLVHSTSSSLTSLQDLTSLRKALYKNGKYRHAMSTFKEAFDHYLEHTEPQSQNILEVHRQYIKLLC